MRTTIIPAQITTVEDKIAGNLNFTQLILLVIPLIINCLVYTLLPERMHLNQYKIVLMLTSFFIFAVLAFRIKGKILINWLILIVQYNLRPKYYIFNKNDLSGRKIEITLGKKEADAKTTKVTITKESSTFSDLASLEKLLTKKTASIKFKPNKGGIYVAVE
jgi:putative ribosome biogenesis GTPase RsgA